MAATIRASTAATATNSPTSPGSTAVGDLVLVVHWTKVDGNGVPTHSIQSGFTEIRSHSHDDGSTDGRLSLAYKVADTSGANAYNAYTSSAGTDFAGIVVLTVGTWENTLVGDIQTSQTTTTNAAPNPASITTPQTQCLVLAIAAWHMTSAAVVTPTVSAGYGLVWEMAGSNAAELVVEQKTVATATAEDPAQLADDVTPNGTCTITVAFRPRAVSLTAATGAFTETGNAAGLALTRKLTAETGAFAQTGTATGLNRGYKLTAATGSFAQTGNAAGLNRGYSLTAATGAYALTGTATTLDYFSLDPQYRASAIDGGTSGTGNRSCAFSGVTNDLLVVHCNVTNNTNTAPTCSDDAGGSYDLVDTIAWDTTTPSMGSVFVRTTRLASTSTVTVTPNTGANDSGEVAVEAYRNIQRTGASAVRSKGKTQNQAAGTTPTATLNQSARTGNVTIFSVFSASSQVPPTNWTERQDAGQNTPAVRTEVATRDAGFTGTIITAASGTFVEWGAHAMELDGSSALIAATGAFTMTGAAAGLVYEAGDPTLVAATGAFALTGNAANLTRAELLTVDTGAYALTGNAVGFASGKGLTATTGAFTMTGNAAGRHLSHIASTGAYVMTGNAANLNFASRIVVATTGVFIMTGRPVVLTGPPGAGGGGVGSMDLGMSLGLT